MGYTKGPWFADDLGRIWRRPPSELYENGGTHAGDHPVARVFRGHHGWAEGFPVEANARLVSSAPELLAMLEELLGAMEASGGWEGDDDLFDRGMALSRRVRGEHA